MYWLGFFTTLIVVALVVMLINKYVFIPSGQSLVNDKPALVLAVVIIVIAAVVWPVFWVLVIVSNVIAALYLLITRFIDKRKNKGKPDV